MVSFGIYSLLMFSINRIRLEFKGYTLAVNKADNKVLIESDWNLKKVQDELIPVLETGINRIRLEFKGLRNQTANL